MSAPGWLAVLTSEVASGATPGSKVTRVSVPGVSVTTAPSTVKVVSLVTGGKMVDLVPMITWTLPGSEGDDGSSGPGFAGLGSEADGGGSAPPTPAESNAEESASSSVRIEVGGA